MKNVNTLAQNGTSILEKMDKKNWKPTVEQMSALFHCAMEYRNESEHTALISLYNDLVGIGGKDVTKD